MIECPKCGGLSSPGTTVCGACGTSLVNVNNNSNINNNPDNGIVLYERSSFNDPVSNNAVKDKHTAISVWHIILFIASVVSYIFIPIRIVKLGVAFVFFYLAESSNFKNSIFLILVRIVAGVQIVGFVIALLIRIFGSVEMMNKFFEYFRF